MSQADKLDLLTQDNGVPPGPGQGLVVIPTAPADDSPNMMVAVVFNDRRVYARVCFVFGMLLSAASAVMAIVARDPAYLAGGFGSGGFLVLHARHMKGAQDLCKGPPDTG